MDLKTIFKKKFFFGIGLLYVQLWTERLVRGCDIFQQSFRKWQIGRWGLASLPWQHYSGKFPKPGKSFSPRKAGLGRFYSCSMPPHTMHGDPWHYVQLVNGTMREKAFSLGWSQWTDRPTDPLPAGGGSVINRLLNACRLHDRNEHLYSSMRAIFPTPKFNPFLTVMGDITF